VAFTAAVVHGQSARDLRRQGERRSTRVTESQAIELTLTLSEAGVRPIQIWVRAGAVITDEQGTLSALVSKAEGAHLAVGQRVRAFPPESRSSMYQARVIGVAPERDQVRVTARLAGPGREGVRRYIMEIVTETEDLLSVPNEAIIASGSTRLVYVQEEEGRYGPREVTLGIEGELYSQILDGLRAGERVVTFGSFFIDAEHRLKGP
jgi:hypothetical protein